MAFQRQGPYFKLDGGVGEHEVEVSSFKQRVELSNCKNCSVRIKGRCSSVEIHSCSEMQILTDDCMQAELNVCSKIEFQIQGEASRFIADRCTETAVMLPANDAGKGPRSADFELISSRCDALKIVLVRDEGKHTVKAVPTTYVTKFDQEDIMKTLPSHR
eukprot:TRINITY_DN11998_c0_g1_i1.p5 TRINITY_DN11998_c0_g1~~TRINITY_DN11998_c0_g1_i1.p5  ORF type:complete len:160 (+),score=24.04 TRINITY_DN11998_c0_g1_i1:1704-2183(+)